MVSFEQTGDGIPVRKEPLMRQSQVKAGRDSAAPIPAPVAEFRMIQQKYRQEQREERPIMDRKQRQEIAEKKQALGLRD